MDRERMGWLDAQYETADAENTEKSEIMDTVTQSITAIVGSLLLASCVANPSNVPVEQTEMEQQAEMEQQDGDTQALLRTTPDHLDPFDSALLRNTTSGESHEQPVNVFSMESQVAICAIDRPDDKYRRGRWNFA